MGDERKDSARKLSHQNKEVYRCVHKDNDLLSTVMIITCFDLSGKQKY